ncbi:hypothetical protein [Brasilonema bromeliae]|uniref:Uncharacterized protein n=1 Tax=Brasilonema bromeliae SPC951 TaxID=385972 RepID=A0ABX1PBQ5_9CYAN|nr:hypothetical protein [Brasilonema bromeliae]NMG21393.1 hypothetical protein [Brasilonema bromeliae SPC951]
MAKITIAQLPTSDSYINELSNTELDATKGGDGNNGNTIILGGGNSGNNINIGDGKAGDNYGGYGYYPYYRYYY